MRKECEAERNVSEPVLFNYDSVSSSIAKFLKGQAERIRHEAGVSVIRIGRALIGAKHYLSHGAFLHWLSSEIGIPARTAQAYMQVAHWAEGKSSKFERLPPSLLYILSAPSTPKEFVSRVLTKVEAGERVALSTVREELRSMRRADAPEEKHSSGPGAKRQSIGGTDDFDGAYDSIATEFVAILAKRLSVKEVARLCTIMSDLNLLRGPDFVHHLITTLQDAESERKEQIALATSESGIAVGGFTHTRQ